MCPCEDMKEYEIHDRWMETRRRIHILTYINICYMCIYCCIVLGLASDLLTVSLMFPESKLAH